VEQLCVISTTRWSARVAKVEPRRCPGKDIYLEVEIQCDGKYYEQLWYCSEDMDAYGPPLKNLIDPRFAPMYANCFGFTLSRADLDNLRFLAIVIEDICMHLLHGQSIKEYWWWWGKSPQSLRGEAKGPTLVINLPDGKFIVDRESFE
jgi:hypothetical protein